MSPRFWSTDNGFECVQELLRGRRTKLYAPSRSTWSTVVTSNLSKIELQCQVCLHVGFSTPNLISKPNYNMRCKCSAQLGKFSDLRMIQKMLPTNALIECSQLEWSSERRNRSSQISMSCNVCNHKFSVSVKSAVRGHLPCKCTGKVQWKTREEEVLQVVQKSRFELEKLPKLLTAKSRLTLRCTRCRTISTPSLSQFVSVGAGCNCLSPEAGSVSHMLEKIALSEERVVPEQGTGIKSTSNRPTALRCDFQVVFSIDNTILIECDGGYHFKREGFKEKVNTTPEHDIEKELHAIECSVPMLRIDNDTIQKHPGKVFDWLKSKVEFARNRQLKGVYRLSHRKAYLDSVYSHLRKATVLEVDDEMLLV